MPHLDCEGLKQLASEAGSVLLTGPSDPDGDSFGACLALQRALRAMGHPRVDVAGTPSFRYAWMPGAGEMIPDERVRPGYDLAIVLDGDRRRLSPPVDVAFRAARTTAIIDHHGTTSADGYTLALIQRDAASTCGMIVELMDAWDVPLDTAFAELLYAGVIFDTGGFRYSNTSADTHRLAARLLDQGIDHSAIATRVLMERRRAGTALKARVLNEVTFHADGAVIQGIVSQALHAELGSRSADVEGIVESMTYTQGVEVAVLLVERGPGAVKLSLRSRGLVNVAQVAKALHSGGGGHDRAAGVLLAKTLAEVRVLLPKVLADEVRRARAA